MASIDYVILKVNAIDASVAFLRRRDGLDPAV